MTGAVLFIHLGDTYAIRFTYNPTIVALIKTTVPGHSRTWDQTRKQWTVDAHWAPPLAAVLTDAGYQVAGLEQPSRDATPRSAWARQLFAAVGPSRHTTVYRALSRCLHPDTPTGSTSLQRELNEAYAELPATPRKTA